MKNASLAGAASLSSLANDPRKRRNAQAGLATDVYLGDGFEVGKGQRLDIAVGPGLCRRNGKICINSQAAPAAVQSTTGSPSMEDLNLLIAKVNELTDTLKAVGVFR